IDITFIRLNHSWVYLIAIIDWFSRFILSLVLDEIVGMDFVLEVVQLAFTFGPPDIFKIDQGSHFAGAKYVYLLKEYPSIQISMDSKGRALDNIMIERFWRSLKYEEVYLNDYEMPKEARTGIRDYINLYNYQRPHQSLNYQTPATIYFS